LAPRDGYTAGMVTLQGWEHRRDGNTAGMGTPQGYVIRRMLLIRHILFDAYFTGLNVPNNRMTYPW